MMDLVPYAMVCIGWFTTLMLFLWVCWERDRLREELAYLRSRQRDKR